MGEVEYEIFGVKVGELRKLRDSTTEIFSKIGTKKSRQRLVYDLLNALKTNDRKRFLYLILKNVNTLKDNNKADEFVKLLNSFYIEYETPENFEKVAYTIVMSIMAVEDIERGGRNE